MGSTPEERLRMYVGRMFRATEVRAADADPTLLRSRTGNIITLKPYWDNQTWVFDDPARGWWARPFQDHSSEMVDQMLRQARLTPRQSFVFAFAGRDWPGVGYRLVLDWVREDRQGHWYRWSAMEGLYPALVRYFDAPPKRIYCHVTARTTLSSIFRRDAPARREAMEQASRLNEVRHTKQRFVALCYRVQESRLRLAQSLAKFNGVRPWMNHDNGHHDLSAPPLYAFVTATNGVRRMMQQPGMAGGAVHRDEAATGLTYTQQYRDGSMVLAVAGDLDLATVSSFRARLKSAADATDNLILDFSRLRSIDAAGIHVLLDVCQTLTLRGRPMALAAVPARVQRVLIAFETDGIFPIFPTVGAAMVAIRAEIPQRQLGD